MRNEERDIRRKGSERRIEPSPPHDYLLPGENLEGYLRRWFDWRHKEYIGSPIIDDELVKEAQEVIELCKTYGLTEDTDSRTGKRYTYEYFAANYLMPHIEKIAKVRMNAPIRYHPRRIHSIDSLRDFAEMHRGAPLDKAQHWLEQVDALLNRIDILRDEGIMDEKTHDNFAKDIGSIDIEQIFNRLYADSRFSTRLTDLDIVPYKEREKRSEPLERRQDNYK